MDWKVMTGDSEPKKNAGNISLTINGMVYPLANTATINT